MFLQNNIAYQNQTLSSEKLQALLLSLKEQKTQDDSWFYCKQVQEMPLRTEMPLGTVVYRGQVDKGEVLSRHRYKETRILLNTLKLSLCLSLLKFAFYFNVVYGFILT